MSSHMNQDFDTDYSHAVEDERAAWHDLQAQPPGSASRAQAWARWSESISKTNAAWRRLSGAQRSSQAIAPHAQAHRSAC
jgi:ferric-dicitrate binding protein FerR (iron transport regulator)